MSEALSATVRSVKGDGPTSELVRLFPGFGGFLTSSRSVVADEGDGLGKEDALSP